MIFANPAGAPELACDECGCRWFDRMSAPPSAAATEAVGYGTCYECGAPVPAEARVAFEAALAAWQRRGNAAPAAKS